MPTGVYVRTEEYRTKLSRAMKNSEKRYRFPKGHIPWNKGLSAKDNEKVRQHIQGLLQYARSPEGRAKSVEVANKHLKNLWEDMSPQERESFIKRRAKRIKETRGQPEAIEKQRKSMVKTHKSNPDWGEKTSKFLKKKHKEDTEYHKKSLTALQKGRDKAWADPKKKEKWLRNWIKGNAMRPTYQEQKVLNVIQKYNLPFKYTGAGDFILAGKMPDFVNINGEKKIIEVFGDFWHDRESSEAQDRIDLFAQYGYKTLILWGKDLNAMSYKEVADRIVKFQ